MVTLISWISWLRSVLKSRIMALTQMILWHVILSICIKLYCYKYETDRTEPSWVKRQLLLANYLEIRETRSSFWRYFQLDQCDIDYIFR